MITTEFSPLSALAGGILIGLAATLLMGAHGRVAGVSGFASRLLPPYQDDQLLHRAAFVAGLALAPMLYVVSTGEIIPTAVTSSVPLLLAGGLLVGFGSVWGSGCTSGHGVCGLARVSPRSLAATATFMGAASITVFLVRHVAGF